MIASLAPRALKDPVRESIREIRQAWEDELRKTHLREEKREQKKEDKREKKAEPKSPPPRAVNQ
jgi:hypothetical protein